MHSNSKHTAKELKKYIQLYVHEEISYKKLCREYRLLLKQQNFNNKILRCQGRGLAGVQSNYKELEVLLTNMTEY